MADPTKGTAVTLLKDPAGTSATSASTFSSGANALLICGITYDDNGSSTTVSSISISGSPTYTTAWQQIATNGRVFDSGQLGSELWYAVASSAITNQAFTVTISSSERFCAVMQSYTNVDTSNPLPASAQAKATTVNVTSSGNDRSLYAGWWGGGDNGVINMAAGSGYTIDGKVNDGGSSLWVHGALESKDAVVTPAATTTVNYTISGAGSPADFPQIIAVEIKGPAAAGGTSHLLTSMGAGQ